MTSIKFSQTLFNLLLPGRLNILLGLNLFHHDGLDPKFISLSACSFHLGKSAFRQQTLTKAFKCVWRYGQDGFKDLLFPAKFFSEFSCYCEPMAIVRRPLFCVVVKI